MRSLWNLFGQLVARVVSARPITSRERNHPTRVFLLRSFALYAYWLVCFSLLVPVNAWLLGSVEQALWFLLPGAIGLPLCVPLALPIAWRHRFAELVRRHSETRAPYLTAAFGHFGIATASAVLLVAFRLPAAWQWTLGALVVLNGLTTGASLLWLSRSLPPGARAA